jgi:arsenite methyltransferase
MSSTLKETVKERYAEAARRAAAGVENDCAPGGDCCGPKSSCCSKGAVELYDPITSNLYDEGQTAGLPVEALLASLGCGNPTALAQLNEGETVLDLGSGGGIDVLLSAKRVGPTGKVFGLDMTDEMLELANENKRRAGAQNVKFLKGEIEDIPLPDNSVDVIISNCVINLSGDKKKVIDESFRVLKHGGRFAVSDVVVRGEAPDEVKKSMELWIGCVAGALEESELVRLMENAGFDEIEIEPTRIYGGEDARAFVEGAGLDPRLVDSIEGKFMSAFIRGRKPKVKVDLATRSCCSGDCCS